jgi:hypothetical protein
MEDRGQRPSRTRGEPTLTGHRWPPAACRAPFVALALCASPLLNFGVANRLDHGDYAVILAVILAFFGGCLAFAALAHFVGSRFDTGIISAASFVMCIFLYSDFSRALRFIGSPRLRLILALWLAASMTLVVLVRRLWTIPGGATALQLLSLMLLVSPVVLSLGAAPTPSTNGREVLRKPPMWMAPPPPPASGLYRPNVYLISHDSYLRADALATFYGFDNRAFTDRLSALGFVLPSRSYANYNFTIPSLTTELGMNYVLSTAAEHRALLRGALRTEEISGETEVATQFKRRGYTYIFANNGFFGSLKCSAFNDVCLNPQISSNELYVALLNLTPGSILAGEISNPSVYSSYTVDRLTDFDPRKQRQPFLFVLHTVGLHNFAWDADCRYRPLPLSHLVSGSTATRSLIKRAYVDQLQCVNRMTLAAVESLLARDPEAIMIIQADHGTWSIGGLRSRPRTAWMATREAEELFAILNAYRLPARCQRYLYDTISPVNSFRVVLSCIDDIDYPLLPDRHFLMSGPEWNGHPFFEEVYFNGQRP